MDASAGLIIAAVLLLCLRRRRCPDSAAVRSEQNEVLMKLDVERRASL